MNSDTDNKKRIWSLKSLIFYFVAFFCLSATIHIYHMHFNDSFVYKNTLAYFILLPLAYAIILNFVKDDVSSKTQTNKKNLLLNLSIIIVCTFLTTINKKRDYCDFVYHSGLYDSYLLDNLQEFPVFIDSLTSTAKQYDKNPLKAEKIEITSSEGISSLKASIVDWLKKSDLSFEDVIVSYEDTQFNDNKKELQIVIKSADKKLGLNDPYITGVFISKNTRAPFSLGGLPENCQKK